MKTKYKSKANKNCFRGRWAIINHDKEGYAAKYEAKFGTFLRIMMSGNIVFCKILSIFSNSVQFTKFCEKFLMWMKLPYVEVPHLPHCQDLVVVLGCCWLPHAVPVYNNTHDETNTLNKLKKPIYQYLPTNYFNKRDPAHASRL